jgi:hypothetical protein
MTLRRVARGDRCPAAVVPFYHPDESCGYDGLRAAFLALDVKVILTPPCIFHY